MKIRRLTNILATAAVSCLLAGCAGPEYYKDAVGKLTTSTNVIVEASDQIMIASQDMYDEARIASGIASGKGTTEVSFYSPSDNSKPPYAVVRPSNSVLPQEDLEIRREFFSTLSRTLSLLNKLADTDYGEAAQKEFEGIGDKFTSIAGKFGDTRPEWKSVSNGLGFFFKALINARREDAIRSALLELTDPQDGVLVQLVALLRRDIYGTVGGNLMVSLQEIRGARLSLLGRDLKSSPGDVRAAAAELRTSITDLLHYAALLEDYSGAIGALEGSIPKIRLDAQSPDFLAVLQHTEGLLVEAAQLKKDLDAIEKDEKAEEAK